MTKRQIGILIIDPALRVMSGHHYNATKAIVEYVNFPNLETQVIANVNCKEDIINVLQAHPSFAKTIYDVGDWNLKVYKTDLKIFYQVLQARIIEWENFPEIIFLPTCDAVQLSSVATLIRKFKPNYPVQIAAWFLFPPFLNEFKNDFVRANQQKEFKKAFVAIEKAVGSIENLHLFGETKGIAEIYDSLFNKILQIRPFINGIPRKTDGLCEVANSERIHLVIAGHATDDKGYALLPDIFRLVMKSHPELRVTIHGDINLCGNPNRLEQLLSIAEISSKIKILPTGLEQADYYSLLRSADLVVLPYDPVVYEIRGSGVFTESRTLGIPVVVPTNCAFAQPALVEKWGVGFKDYNAASIASAISKALRDIRKLKTNAQRFASVFAATSHIDDDIRAMISRAEANVPIRHKFSMVSFLNSLFRRFYA